MKIAKIEVFMVPGPGETEQDNPTRVIVVAPNRVDNILYPNEVKLASYLLDIIVERNKNK